jgi:hypothetical protein
MRQPQPSARGNQPILAGNRLFCRVKNIDGLKGLQVFETSFNQTTAVIFAGGLGTRLRSVVADRPKILAPICGKPFLSYILDQLMEIGIQYTALCTGYLGDMVQASFGDHYGTMNLGYSKEQEP